MVFYSVAMGCLWRMPRVCCYDGFLPQFHLAADQNEDFFLSYSLDVQVIPPCIGMLSLFREFELSLSVQASIAANTWVVSGSPQTKMQDLLPELSTNCNNSSEMPGGAAAILGKIPEEDDDDVPDLMDRETFEAAADEEKVAS
ncbi:hypothetical protein MKW92_015491 [Papaver armeniacum]|nr:hypothetical protein MKW92_015491 [Papaver armeniacum]